MQINKIIWPSVGADLSALAGFSDSSLILLISIIAPLLCHPDNSLHLSC